VCYFVLMSTESNVSTETSRTIADARTAKQMSLRDFAAELMVSANVVSLWERGIQEPGRETLAGWYTDEREWVRQMAIDIFVARYREALTSRGITVPLAA